MSPWIFLLKQKAPWLWINPSPDHWGLLAGIELTIALSGSWPMSELFKSINMPWKTWGSYNKLLYVVNSTGTQKDNNSMPTSLPAAVFLGDVSRKIWVWPKDTFSIALFLCSLLSFAVRCSAGKQNIVKYNEENVLKDMIIIYSEIIVSCWYVNADQAK